MSFTPGPWRFKEEDVDVHDGSYTEPTVVTETDERGVARVIAIIRIGLKGTNANGQLIAAAPDMLLELSRLSREVGGILYGFERELREAIGNTNFAVLRQKVKEAESVIAKAEGR